MQWIHQGQAFREASRGLHCSAMGGALKKHAATIDPGTLQESLESFARVASFVAHRCSRCKAAVLHNVGSTISKARQIWLSAANDLTVLRGSADSLWSGLGTYSCYPTAIPHNQYTGNYSLLWTSSLRIWQLLDAFGVGIASIKGRQGHSARFGVQSSGIQLAFTLTSLNSKRVLLRCAKVGASLLFARQS